MLDNMSLQRLRYVASAIFQAIGLDGTVSLASVSSHLCSSWILILLPLLISFGGVFHLCDRGVHIVS